MGATGMHSYFLLTTSCNKVEFSLFDQSTPMLFMDTMNPIYVYYIV